MTQYLIMKKNMEIKLKMRDDKKEKKSQKKREIVNKKTWEYEEGEVVICRKIFKTNKGKYILYENTMFIS